MHFNEIMLQDMFKQLIFILFSEKAPTQNQYNDTMHRNDFKSPETIIIYKLMHMK